MGTVATLAVRVTASTTEFEKNIGKLEAQWKRVGSRFESAGASLTKGLTLPLLAIGGSAVKAAVTFESSFAGIKKTVQGTAAEFDALAAGMREMAKTKPVDVNDLNRIGEIGGQLGIATGDILKFTDTVADMQIATGLSTEEVARGLGTIAKLTKTPAEGFRGLGDTIAALGDAGSATESQIIEFGQRIAATGTLAGMTSNEVLAIGASMANLGIEADAGGTAVQKMIMEMISAVQTGGDSLQGFAETAGMTGAQFQAAFSADPGQAFLAFIEGLEKQGKGAITTLDELGLKDVRLQRAFLGLASAGGELRSSFEVAAGSTGKLSHEVGIFSATTESQMKMLSNQAYDVAITFGQQLVPELLKLIPAFKETLSAIAEVVHWFAELPGPVKTATLEFAAFMAILGPAAFAIGKLYQAGAGLLGLMRLSGVATVIGTLGTAFKELITFTSAFGGEGLIVGLEGIAKAVFTLASANPVVFFVSLGTAVITLSKTWTEAFAVIAATPIGGIISSWRSLRESWDAYFGDLKMPELSKDNAPFKHAINAPIGPAMDIGRAMALLDQPGATRGGGGGGGGGGGEESPLAKAIKGIQDRMKSAVVDARAWAQEIEREGGVTHATAYAKEQLADALDTVIKQYGSLEKAGLGAMQPLLEATKKVLDSTRAIPEAMGAFTGPQMGADGNLGGLMSELGKLPDTTNSINGQLSKYYTSLQDVANQAGMTGLPDVQTINVTEQATEYAAEQMADTAKRTVDGIRDAFQYFTGSLGHGMAAMLGGLLNTIEKEANKAGSPLQKLLGGKWGSRIGTGLDIGMGAFGGGFSMGEQFGKGGGALAGAGSGALTGFMAGGPIGAAIGGIAGLLGGLFGGGKRKREQQAKMAEAKGQLVDQFGGMEGLQQAATLAGVSLDTLFKTENAKTFEAELKKVTGAIEEMQKRVAGTVDAIDKVMAKGGLIGKELWQSILSDQDAEAIKAKLQEVFDASVQRSAEGFNKIASNFETLKAPISEIGVLADAAFAGLLAGGASIPEAIAQMGDGLAHLQELLASSGQTATGPLATLLDYQKIAESNKGLFELLSGVQDMIVGLGNSGLLTQERFTALGQTITQAFGQLQSQGVAAGTALEMMQPQLQKLWEAEQTFGLKTDAATQALIDQAVQQGIVGEAMKDVNHQILDVLTAIAVALGAEIPQAVQTAGSAITGFAGDASAKFDALGQHARGIFDGIPSHIPIQFDMRLTGEMPPVSGGAQPVTIGAGSGLASATTPSSTGEAVVPATQYRETSLNMTVNGTADRDFATLLAKQIALGGAPKTTWQGALK